jgi:hypothetical protein
MNCKLKKKVDFINAIYHEQYHSLHCWETVEQAITEYGNIKTETQKLRILQEQILIRLLGFGW